MRSGTTPLDPAGHAAAYLARIGASPPTASDADTLAELTARHLASVPFENLSLHLGEPVVLEDDALLDKLVRRHRGGFCYELNGGFAVLLRAVGYDVSLLSARVFLPGGLLGPPYDHLALRVDLTAGEGVEPWLADVGFGRFVARPFRLDERGDQADPLGTVRLVDAPDGDLDVLLDGVPQYRLDPRPRQLGDFVATCWWQQTHPTSHFLQSLTCSLPTPRGRVTLSERLLITTEDGVRTERVLPDDEAVLACYRDVFGIDLDRVPSLSAPRPGM
jgi:N-hydroxyarylamine O-acetyltransferase